MNDSLLYNDTIKSTFPHNGIIMAVFYSRGGIGLSKIIDRAAQVQYLGLYEDQKADINKSRSFEMIPNF
jgi:hypothetical protein